MPPREKVIGLGEALLQLAEAVSRAKGLKKKAKLETALERKVAKAFRAQGAEFVKRLKTLEGSFPMKESISPEDWLPLFDAAALSTLEGFTVPVDVAIVDAFKLGSVMVRQSGGIALDLENPRAVSWLKDRAAEQVTKINETTREYLATVVNDGIAQGHSYTKMAKAITDRYGEFAVGKPQEHIQSRAHLVAITEVGEAYAEGNLQMGQQLEDAGIPMEKSWLDSGDGKVSQGCLDNAAAGWIPLKDDFPSGHERPLRFPGCRCDLLVQQADEASGGGKKPPRGGGGDEGDRVASKRAISRFVKRETWEPKETINVAKVPKDLQDAIGAKSETLRLSGDTIAKQRKKHGELPFSLYQNVQGILNDAELIVQDGPNTLALVKQDDRMVYMALKTTADGSENYLLSLRWARSGDPARARKKAAESGKVIRDELT